MSDEEFKEFLANPQMKRLLALCALPPDYEQLSDEEITVWLEAKNQDLQREAKSRGADPDTDMRWSLNEHWRAKGESWK